MIHMIWTILLNYKMSPEVKHFAFLHNWDYSIIGIIHFKRQSHFWFGISDLETQIRFRFYILHHCQCSVGPVKWTDQRILANIGDGEKSDFNFIDIKRMIPLENTLIIRAQIAYYIDSEDTLIGKLSLYSFIITYSLYDIGHSLSHRIPT